MILKFTVLVFVSDIKRTVSVREKDSFIKHTRILVFLLNLFIFTSPSLIILQLLKRKPHTKQCAPSDIDKINLSLYMPNNFVLALPVRKKCVSVFMGLRVCLLFCHTTYYVCLNLRVFISLTRKNNCMFTNIKAKKFWTGPVSKVAHICAQLQARRTTSVAWIYD